MSEQLRLIFAILAKGWRDPEIKRSPEEAKKSFGIYMHMVRQVQQGTCPEKVKPPKEFSPAQTKALLKGTGIHHQLIWERWNYLRHNPGITTENTDPQRQIQNEYLPPRPTAFS